MHVFSQTDSYIVGIIVGVAVVAGVPLKTGIPGPMLFHRNQSISFYSVFRIKNDEYFEDEFLKYKCSSRKDTLLTTLLDVTEYFD